MSEFSLQVLHIEFDRDIVSCSNYPIQIWSNWELNTEPLEPKTRHLTTVPDQDNVVKEWQEQDGVQVNVRL